MNFRTNIQLQKESNQIDYSSNLVLIGSCFSENISNKLQIDYKKLMNEYFLRVNYANIHFNYPKKPGWMSDRGKIYIPMGKWRKYKYCFEASAGHCKRDSNGFIRLYSNRVSGHNGKYFRPCL